MASFKDAVLLAALLLSSTLYVSGQDCNDEDLRLRGGPTYNQGRVEICNNNEWATICDDEWDINDATVVCNDLGFPGAISAQQTAFYGRGAGTILYGNVDCDGTESSFADCTRPAPFFCSHSEDAGVECNLNIRLADGPTMYEGRVELYHNGEWGTVCDDRMSFFQELTLHEANVACAELSFGPAVESFTTFFEGYSLASGPIILDEVQCIGTESNLFECDSNDVRMNDCSHFEDWGIRCHAPIPCQEGDLRLVGSEVEGEGRVEICHSSVWGTVCDDAWDNDDGAVVCRQLGFVDVVESPGTSTFGRGTGPITLDQVACTGSETRLLDCGANDVFNEDCSHFEDAGVRCMICNDGDVRLVRGNNEFEGAVEVCESNAYKPVCDSGWDLTDAGVVCSQLGYGAATSATTGSSFGDASVFPVAINVNCGGTESNLLGCLFDTPTARCDAAAAGLACTSNCTEGAVRLVGGPYGHTGRVEICFNNTWGTVCDDDWDDNDAMVVCRQLGESGGTGHQGDEFAGGQEPTWLDQVACDGTEQTLANCMANDLGVEDCSHREDASVTCDGPIPSTFVCGEGSVRLVDGPDSRQGRVEICTDNSWGTVCDNSFSGVSNNFASVICRQSGFQGSAAITTEYGAGTGDIKIALSSCTGSEGSWSQCDYTLRLGVCTHTDDIGVNCGRICTNGELRLVDGSTAREGRVEICYEDEWGTVCDDSWDTDDASVVCFQLGYGRTATARTDAFFGQGTGPILYDEFGCTGTETRLTSCSHDGVANHDCFHFEDAGVECTGNCAEDSVRLVDGSTAREGRVEVCIGGEWGTVCDDGWDDNDATVVCRELGFTTIGALARTNAFFGEGTGNIIYWFVGCTGDEQLFSDCSASTSPFCSHFEDAGVVCQENTGCTDYDVRLVDGANEREGRVELCLGGVWGTICDDDWDTNNARVICGQAGYARETAVATVEASFGAGTGPIHQPNLDCTGDEPTLESCGPVFHFFCTHSEDSGVICSVCDDGAVRIIDGSADNNGRVEVCLNDEWGTVCNNNFDSADAGVICSLAGYSRFDATTSIAAVSGADTVPILLTDVGCNGTELSIFDCPFSTPTAAECTHLEDVGVTCRVDLICRNGEVRLVDGTISSGRVEICLREIWGTVCGTEWGPEEGGIVCGQLGYSRLNAMTSGDATFGVGTGPIHLTDLFCVGDEPSLLVCPGADSSTAACNHDLDAGVVCQREVVCANGDIRLAGDMATEMSGRVEICYDEQWGTICDDFWDEDAAGVACRQLGFSADGASAVGSAGFGLGVGEIFVRTINCNGREDRLADCSIDMTSPFCVHSEDSGVVCQAIEPPCHNGDVRLVGGSRAGEGRVEMCRFHTWGTVCDDGWDYEAANVVCMQLGYVPGGSHVARSGSSFGQGTGPIWGRNFMCDGTEIRLELCSYSEDPGNCTHVNDAGVECQECTYGAIRLLNGNRATEGLVEVCTMANQWGSVCDDDWDINDATVACRQAGLLPSPTIGLVEPHQGGFFTPGPFGAAQSPILLDDLGCVGDETSLFNCPHPGEGTHNCGSTEGAAVSCPIDSCIDGDIRLAGSINNTLGVVEVCSLSVWYTACNTNFDAITARVACRQLGFSFFHADVLNSADFGTGPPFLVDDVQCTGNEARVIDCPFSFTIGPNCDTSSTAIAIACKEDLVCEDSQLRLVGGSDMYEGRVEVCYNEVWNTICADGAWTSIDANVACREAGFSATGATAFTDAFFGAGTGPQLIDQYECSGTESRLIDCTYIPNTSGCVRGHLQDAGVRCGQGCTDGEVRLADGGDASEGRVEVCLNGEWGTVCDDNWDDVDASVVCRQLGFNFDGAEAFSFSFFGLGTGSIHLDDVACTGTESRLIDCPYNPTHNCFHFEDASVRCQGCIPGAVRLANGDRPSMGRVEICMNDVWGTVCSREFDVRDASVVCRQLGYSVSNPVLRLDNFYTPVADASVPIYLSALECDSTENRLVDCTATTFFTNCVHSQDAGVMCNEFTVCNEGDVRLMGGSNDFEGRLEVCIGEVWGTVCDDGWNDMDSNIACQQLGYSRQGAQAILDTRFGQGSGPIHIDNVACSGGENRILECYHTTDTSACTHAEDASIICNPDLFCEDAELRLVDGTNQFEGRLEICYQEVWGTICSSFFGSFVTADANVACRQLGYQPSGGEVFYGAFFGEGPGPIWLDDIFCFGNEPRLVDCINSGFGLHDFCDGHADDISIRCVEGCINGQVRLVDGTAEGEGRVEVCSDQTWGTVCDDGWGMEDAIVVCRQLGYSRLGAAANISAAFGAGTGTIVFDNVACTGTETSIFDCASDTDTSDCTHSKDAGVTCNVELFCEDGDLRLAGNMAVPNEGRVEVCINEEWGTVCDNSWGSDDAAVACREVGFSRFGAFALSSAFFGQGTGEIFYDALACTGSETRLRDCPRAGTVSLSCSHANDAGVRCDANLACRDGDIRIVTQGTVPSNGRVEVCIDEEWATICDAAWDNTDASVACRQAGYSRHNAVARSMAVFGQGTGAIIEGLACTGNELRVFDCPRGTTTICNHAQDAGVECTVDLRCMEGAVRLVDGDNPMQGRVEVCLNEEWSTVCDNHWSLNDANVVCRQLGNAGQGAQIFVNAAFGQGTGPIGIDTVLCGGTETMLLDCPFSTDVSLCTHADDAGVQCLEACDEGDLRLVDGNNPNGMFNGRLEVCLNEQWGVVCDDLWDSVDAGVACKQLGYSQTGATAFGFSQFGTGSGPIWLDNVECDGSEDRLIDCPYVDMHNCFSSEIAGISCFPCSNGEIRLEGGSTRYEGRVEVCRDQTWGTVCDDMWSATDAQVVCRHLQYSGFGAQALQSAHFGQGTGPIYMDNVACTGTEIDLFDCPHDEIHNCAHDQDASVICEFPPVCVENAVRLRNGSFANEGRVEICNVETWKTICDINWSSEDASVVCKQLGFSKYNAVARPGDTFPRGTGAIYGSSVLCTGEEEMLSDCMYSTSIVGCGHPNDAGVTCTVDLVCQDGDVRLVGGTSPMEGRLEICVDEDWGTVCDTSAFGFGTDAGNVVCRQLEYAPVGSTVRPNAFYGQGTGPIHYDGFGCTGQESRLVDCPNNGAGMIGTFCQHTSDIGVVCGAVCESGSIRLMNGVSVYSGRVEVCREESWGTICDSGWTQEDANVACKQSGFSRYNATAHGNAFFGQGLGLIHLNDLQCTGREDSLFACSSSPVTGCTHANDAGVTCVQEFRCNNGDIRLCLGDNCGAGVIEGRIEYCFNEDWGTICNNMWSASDAEVACRELGFSSLLGGQAIVDGRYGSAPSTVAIFAGGFACSGQEMRLRDCSSTGTSGCTHAMDAGLACREKICQNGDVRLSDGSNMDSRGRLTEGRVEFCWNEVWGTVCDNGFDNIDALVICQETGFSRNGAVAISGTDSPFPQASSGVPVQLENLGCTAANNMVIGCTYDGVGNTTCDHKQDSAVRCQIRPSFPAMVTATPNTDTSLIVEWRQPVEFYSTLLFYRVTCGHITTDVIPSTQMLTVNGLLAATTYTCSVEARYSDETENAAASAQATTLEGIPGVPRNLGFEPLDATQCGTVTFTWDPPTIDERNGVISMYEITVTRVSTGEIVITRTTSNEWYTNTTLSCCTDYSFRVSAATSAGFGPRASAIPVRTLADLAVPIVVTVTIPTDDSITVQWTTPQNVVAQSIAGDEIIVTAIPNCFDGQNNAIATPNPITVPAISTSFVTFTGLAGDVPYVITVVARVCQSAVQIHQGQHFTVLSSSIELAPVVTATARIPEDPTRGSILWESDSADVVDVSLYSGDPSDQDNFIGTAAVSSGSKQVMFAGLDYCTVYWVVARAAICAAEIFSEPFAIDVRDSEIFEFSFMIDGQCDDFISVDYDANINAIHTGLNSILNSTICAFIRVTCFTNGTFECDIEKPNTVYFRTTLVGHGTGRTSTDQAECLSDWVQDEPAVTLANGMDVSAIPPTVPPIPAGTLPGYAIALIIVAVLILVLLILVMVAVILLVRRKPGGPKKPAESNLPHHLMDDQDDNISISRHSIGIVENPLFADNDGMENAPSYAALKAKEAEAEEEFGYSMPPVGDQGFSINFDPPNDY